ncbi:MAG: DUF5337 family protein [Mangrovicoccus sp.]
MNMTAHFDQDLAKAKKARLVAVVLLVTVVLWMAGQWLGGQAGIAVRYVFLLDFAALAAFAWALIVTLQLWRARAGEKAEDKDKGLGDA